MSKNELKVYGLQISMHWEDVEANLRRYDEWLSQLSPGMADIIVLPEMFQTGFSMKPQLFAEEPGGSTTQWMQAQSRRLDAAITGSIMIVEGGKYYNRLLWVTPDGAVRHYDKRHLFSLAGEEKVYAPGKERLLVEWRGWRILPLVCYDLRFPVWARNRMTDGAAEYDLALFVANWPERRVAAWSKLLVARAIENQCYIIGVNRVGEDGNGVYHSGHSAIHDAFGETMAAASPGKEEWMSAVLEKEKLADIRSKLSFLADQDQFEIII